MAPSSPCSVVCPHSFSGAAIKEMIATEHGRTGCPVTGCAKVLTLGTIQADEGLRRRVAAHERRVKEGRTQGGATQGRTFVQMDLGSDEEEEEDDEEGERAVRKVKKEKARA